MHPLERKLARDLWRLRGQVLALAMVVACGVAVLATFLGSVDALQQTASAYYERYRFADVFAKVKRAPDTLRERMAQIPGVQWVETRVTKLATVDVEGFDEPVVAQLVSLPERPSLNLLVLRAGRVVAPGKANEIVVNEPFAKAHGLKVGDHIKALINGRRRTLTIVGLALSPEFVYAMGPGALMPDKKRFAILWMDHEVLATTFDLKGAFNDVALKLQRGARTNDVIDRLDQILARYGGIGAIPRADQISNWFLMNEIKQMETMSSVLPAIFLIVAALLANMVLARLIAVERAEIGLLKAFGYSNGAVGWHYAKMVLAMTLLGILIGVVGGYFLGKLFTGLYANLFNFPFLLFRPGPAPFVIAGLVSLASTLLGAASSVRRAVRQPPAEAMRPPAPPTFHRGLFGGAADSADRRGGRWIDQPTRIVLRQIIRWPRRSLMTSLGIGFGIALLVVSLQWIDAINHMIRVHFFQAQHQDVTVALDEVRTTRVLAGLARLPGVLATEPQRTVAVRFRFGNRTHRDGITGLRQDARLAPVHDVSGKIVPIPRDGLLISKTLATKLNAKPGDVLTVEVLEAHRPVRRIPIAGLFETYIGTPAYMNINAVNRLMRERPVTNIVLMRIDPLQRKALYKTLKDQPAVAAVMLRESALQIFEETMAETMWISITFFVSFACVIAFGVVYNSARIALSERGRELATLRVIGFSRPEISYILLGEVALITLLALPIGCLIGYFLAGFIVQDMATELFRVPFIIEPGTYGLAILIGLAATTLSAFVVQRRLNNLDLIAVLKTRE